jgi:molybdopterin synthase sulfur carrier subunit
MPTVSFTRVLQRFLAAPYANVEGATVGDALGAVFASRSTLRGYVLDDQGAPRRHVVIYVNGRPVNDRAGLSDPVGPRDGIYVFQTLSGGYEG